MTSKAIQHITNPIDAVITWVDGDCPEFKRKMESYLGGENRRKIPGAHQTRFASINEIKYCLLSILKFAPFIRNIYIVTDGQDPNLYSDIKKYYPERIDSIRIVDHKEIFSGYESNLPTFSSRSIEFMLWRIKGLSDNFVYFNDDFILIRSIKPEDWFINSKPVLRGNWATLPLFRILWNSIRINANRFLLNNSTFKPRPSFHLGQWYSASTLGFRLNYFKYNHTPSAINRKILEDFFANNEALLQQNIAFRFRNHNQLGFVAFANHLEILNGNKHFAKPDLAYLQPYKRNHNYIENKIQFCESTPQIKYLCIQSLEMCTKEQQSKIFGWMDGILGIKTSV